MPGMTNRSKIGCGLLLLLFLFTLGVAGGKVYHEGHQQKLDSALLTAVKESNLPTVRSLIAEGADINARDLPLDTRSTWWKLWDRLRGEPLLTGDMPTALMVAQSNTHPNAFSVANALLDAGAAINAKDKRGSTALYYAIDLGDVDFVQALLTRGALVNVKNNEGKTPLHWASYNGRQDFVRLLIEKGGDVNARDDSGDTPLCLAVLFNHATCVERLLVRGAQANIKDYGGYTPLMLAQENQNAQIIAMLKQAGSKE
jgi:ankyrin repeat protein